MCIRLQILASMNCYGANVLTTFVVIWSVLVYPAVAISRGCPKLQSHANLVVIVGQGDTGSRGIAYLLDRMGVFIVTGDHRCTERSREVECQAQPSLFVSTMHSEEQGIFEHSHIVLSST